MFSFGFSPDRFRSDRPGRVRKNNTNRIYVPENCRSVLLEAAVFPGADSYNNENHIITTGLEKSPHNLKRVLH